VSSLLLNYYFVCPVSEQEKKLGGTEAVSRRACGPTDLSETESNSLRREYINQTLYPIINGGKINDIR
jgi:hypothetical protein